MSFDVNKGIRGNLVRRWQVPKTGKARDQSDSEGRLWGRFWWREGSLPDLSASSSSSQRNNVSLGDEKASLCAGFNCHVVVPSEEWQAGAAAGHSQCQAAQPTALGQSGPAGLGVLPTSAPPPPPLGAKHWDSGAEGSAETGRGATGGRERGGASGRVSATLKLIHLILPFPSPPSCFSDCQHQ